MPVCSKVPRCGRISRFLAANSSSGMKASTYIHHPPFFQNLTSDVPSIQEIKGARVLARLGNSITTDHISPAGNIAMDSPAGQYLQERGVQPRDFNSYGARRGNDLVMTRGTFANIRLKNLLAGGKEGWFTRYFRPGDEEPTEEQTTIFAAATKYQAQGIPTIVIAGKEYGTGSSRDWAAKGPLLLGVRAAIAKSFERIHRSNLSEWAFCHCVLWMVRTPKAKFGWQRGLRYRRVE